MALSMDEQHRADSRLERELRDTAERLMLLTMDDALEGGRLAEDCRLLARELTVEADRRVRCWD